MAQEPEGRTSLQRWKPEPFPWESQEKVDQEKKKSADQYRNFNYMIGIIFCIGWYVFIKVMGK